MIKHIIFDFGGVILKHRQTLIEDILQKMFSEHFDHVFKLWKKHKIYLNIGKISSEEFLLELKRHTQVPKSVEELKNQWKELYIKEADNVDWELLKYIEKLKENYSVYLLTDTIDVHDEYNRGRDIYTKFNHVFKSFEEKIAKLEGERAFRNILEKINALPAECVFIDDLPDNIKNAKRIGMQGIHYKDRKQLQGELEKLGLKI